MRINAKGLQIIRDCESLRLAAYYCPSGKPTIGYGHTTGVAMGLTCIPEQADAWLVEDTWEAENAIKDLVKAPLTANQFSALVSFVFNVGMYSFGSSTLLKVLNLGDYTSVPDQLRRWVFGRQGSVKVKLPGLVKRREMEAALWSEPV